jgi:hypothetical protein
LGRWQRSNGSGSSRGTYGSGSTAGRGISSRRSFNGSSGSSRSMFSPLRAMDDRQQALETQLQLAARLKLLMAKQ